MKITTLERRSQELQDTIFKDYKDKVSVSIGLKCLVVCFNTSSWEGDLLSEFKGIPITYLFNTNLTHRLPG